MTAAMGDHDELMAEPFVNWPAYARSREAALKVF
jgi:hypothetical protein